MVPRISLSSPANLADPLSTPLIVPDDTRLRTWTRYSSKLSPKNLARDLALHTRVKALHTRVKALY